MVFYQIEFLILLAGLVALLRLIPGGAGGNTWRKLLLLAASWYFYAYWDWRFLSLVLAGTLVDYAAGLAMGRVRGTRARRGVLLASLAFDLGTLGYFKYAGFFLENLAALSGSAPTGPMPVLLPLGISFFTFQRMTYVIDVYRGRMQAEPSLLHFALFAAFFPTITAGPITRARDLLPQFREGRTPTAQRVYLGLRRFTLGAFKKLVLADRLAPFVDTVFANPGAFDTPTAWLGAVAYSLQLYLDFSGYSDMAIGTAQCLGYDLPRNFDYPYISRNISEFWRRWHISMSTWFRDYLYIPLGGNRRGTLRTQANLLITMTLCGLWHGAGWTFVFWGLLHGVGLMVHRVRRIYAPPPERAHPLAAALSWGLTMLLVLVGWVFFRAPDFAHAWTLLGRMALPAPGLTWQFPMAWVVLGGVGVVHGLRVLRGPGFSPCPPRAWYAPALLLTLAGLSILFAPQEFAPFLYARF